MQKISFVIPVYQNEGSLLLTAKKIITLFESQLKKYTYEKIVEDIKL